MLVQTDLRAGGKCGSCGDDVYIANVFVNLNWQIVILNTGDNTQHAHQNNGG